MICPGLFLALCCLFSGASAQESSPEVQVAEGRVRGTYENADSMVYSAFKGIPYAKPPTGDRRFKDPEKPERWSSLEATRFRSACPQWDVKGNKLEDEDCLFINVFTPAKFESGQDSSRFNFPVMVFIHGGEFQRGSAHPYGPEKLITQGIVVVTFNYRLGILGFLSTGDAACPGNLGLKDQVMALQWVRDNIRFFGGRPDLVTIFGQDAGAASVFLHLLSPQSKGLFEYAITQSGSPLCDWSMEEKPYEYAADVADRLKCSTKSTWGMVECLRKKPVMDILNAQKPNKAFGSFPIRTLPVVEREGGFLPDHPLKLLASSGSRTPLVSGVNADDGAIFYSLIESHKEDIRRNASFLKTDIIPNFLRNVTDMRRNIGSVTQTLLFEYFNEVDPANITQVISAFVNMTSDAMFVSCNHKTMELYSATGAPTYMYTFEYRGEMSMLNVEKGEPNFPGVGHGDELLYLFRYNNIQQQLTNDQKISNQMLSLWANFAKTGKMPESSTYDMPRWEPYTAGLQSYYSIRPTKIELLTAYRQRAAKLWMDLLPALSNVTAEYFVEYRTGGLGWTMLALALVLAVAAGVLGFLLFKKSKSQYFQATTENK